MKPKSGYSLRLFSITEHVPDTEYKVRVLSGIVDGYSKLLDAKWPWLIYRTPQDNERSQGRHDFLCTKTLLSHFFRDAFSVD